MQRMKESLSFFLKALHSRTLFPGPSRLVDLPPEKPFVEGLNPDLFMGVFRFSIHQNLWVETPKLGDQNAESHNFFRSSSLQSLRATRELLPLRAFAISEMLIFGGYSAFWL